MDTIDVKLFLELIIISACSVPVVLLCHKFKISIIVGFLLTGVIINPEIGIFKFMDIHTIHILSEIGVICLLFTIGLEFSLNKIKSMRNEMMIGGGLQVFGTVAVVALIVIAFNMPVNQAIFLGCLVAISSTALKLSLLHNKGAINTPYGQVSVAVTIFQDIAAVIMIILVPLFGGDYASSGGFANVLKSLSIKFVIVFAVAAIYHFFIVPKVLYFVAKTQSRELFIVMVFFIFMSIVGLTGYLGVSMALGAFIAGVLISESPYSHRANGVIMPFKDIFTSIFFVSQGLMLDLSFAMKNIHILILIAVVIMLLKLACAFLSIATVRGLGIVSFNASIYLAQVGEFSFVLWQEGSKYSLMSQEAWNLFLGASIITMLLTPNMVDKSQDIFDFFKNIFSKVNIKFSDDLQEQLGEVLKDHIIIIGYGIVGRRLAYGAQIAGIKYVVIEMNPDTVEEEKKKGVPIFYGDATEEAVLEHAKIDSARAIAISIPTDSAVTSIVEISHRMNENLFILVRTRFEQQAMDLTGLGADTVVVEEKEVSYKMLSQILKYYLVPIDNIDNILLEQQSEDTGSLGLHANMVNLEQSKGEHQIYAIRVPKNSFPVNKTLQEIDLRKNYGVSVIMIKRKDKEIVEIGEEKILEGDVLIVFAARIKIAGFMRKLDVVLLDSEDVL